MRKNDIIEFGDMSCKVCAFHESYGGLAMCTVVIEGLRHNIPKAIFEEIIRLRKENEELKFGFFDCYVFNSRRFESCPLHLGDKG